MLAVNAYSGEAIAAARARVDAQLAAYRKFAASAGAKERAAFEPGFFAAMVLALDRYFVHRTRALEKKDGNPLNEVRMICASLTEGDGTLKADPTIKYDPAKSVTGLKLGEPIVLDAERFAALAKAFFAEIAAKFG
ncbi:MAG: hypothetical protein U1E56_01710 [Bauldia sp.]